MHQGMRVCIRCLGPFLGLFSLQFVGVVFFFLLLFVCMIWGGGMESGQKGGWKGKKTNYRVLYSLWAIQLPSSFIIQGKREQKQQRKVQGVKKWGWIESGSGQVGEWTSEREKNKGGVVLCFVVVVSEYERVWRASKQYRGMLLESTSLSVVIGVN